MRCLASKDQPLRVRLTKNGVVHAAAYRDFGGFTRYTYGNRGDRLGTKEFVPKQKRIEMACRWRPPKKDLSRYLVPNTEYITCKACMKRMGMAEGPESPKRFVVRRKDTGEFMKNTSSRCSGWSDSITDAFFFRKEHTARAKCNVWRYRVGRKLMTYSEWAGAGRPEHEHKKLPDPNLEVRAVKFTLE